MPVRIDGTDITGVTIDNEDVQEITVDGDTVFTAGPPGAFDITRVNQPAQATLNTQDGRSSGLVFSTDGTKLYEVGFGSNQVYEYTLGTGFDINTASFIQSFNPGFSSIEGVEIKPDGTKLYVLARRNARIQQFGLSPAFSLNNPTLEHNLTDAVFDGQSFRFGDNGSRAVINDTFDINQVSLSTPFDISSFSPDGGITPNFGSLRGFEFNGNGTNMYIGDSDDDIHQVPLSTPFDITTGGSATSVGFADDYKNITWSTDGGKFYGIKDGGPIEEFTVS